MPLLAARGAKVLVADLRAADATASHEAFIEIVLFAKLDAIDHRHTKMMFRGA
jgi:hypothetical protein